MRRVIDGIEDSADGGASSNAPTKSAMLMLIMPAPILPLHYCECFRECLVTRRVETTALSTIDRFDTLVLTRP
jgi:hypothetical protein